MGTQPMPQVIDRRHCGHSTLVLRAVGAADAPALQALWARQPPPVQRLRFHGACKGATAAALQVQCTDRRGQRSVVVEQLDAQAPPRLLAEARYAAARQPGWADFALLVDVAVQQQGLGRWVLQALLRRAAADGLQGLRGDVLADNPGMRALARSLGAVEWEGEFGPASCVVELSCLDGSWSARLTRYLNAWLLPSRALSGLALPRR
jgi:RimJ/RimL family protein N-acetyltransferase